MNESLQYYYFNKNIIIKSIISFLICLSCIFLTGTHGQFNYFLIILLLYYFFNKDINFYLRGTFFADLVLSIFFLSFSWIDYGAFVEYRHRSFALASLYPAITVFLLSIYLLVYKDSKFKIKSFVKKQTYLPFFSILLGIFSGISSQINPYLGILSVIHYIFLCLFIGLNFFLLKRFVNDGEIILKIIPIILYFFTLLVCKSKASLICTFILFLSCFLRVKEFRTIFKLEKQKNYLIKIINTFSFFLVMILLIINLVSFDKVNFSNKLIFIDQLIGNRILINNSFIKASGSFEYEKINPQFIPNKEYRVGKKVNEIMFKNNFTEEREKYIRKIYKKDEFKVNKRKLLRTNPHNSFIYYFAVHNNLWLYFLFSLIIILSLTFLIKNQIISFINFFILNSMMTLEGIPYLNSIFLVIISYLIILFFNSSFKFKN